MKKGILKTREKAENQGRLKSRSQQQKAEIKKKKKKAVFEPFDFGRRGKVSLDLHQFKCGS